MKAIRLFINAHRFFCAESAKYSGMTIISNPVKVAKAWGRFMWISLAGKRTVQP